MRPYVDVSARGSVPGRLVCWPPRRERAGGGLGAGGRRQGRRWAEMGPGWEGGAGKGRAAGVAGAAETRRGLRRKGKARRSPAALWRCFSLQDALPGRVLYHVLAAHAARPTRCPSVAVLFSADEGAQICAGECLEGEGAWGYRWGLILCNWGLLSLMLAVCGWRDKNRRCQRQRART